MGRAKKYNELPRITDLYKPVIQSLIDLGGSGSIEEIQESVYKLMKLPENLLNIPHGDGNRSEIEYRLAWARSHLKRYGLLENSSRGVWALTTLNITPEQLDTMLDKHKQADTQNLTMPKINTEAIDSESEVETWKEELLHKLLNIPPSAFERLAQRLLRESGFVQVDVTGKTGDGGIDGKGIVRINGFLSFHVIFQCKRYKGAITPSQIRDFRGAMQGRTDKGLFITTGIFTREAINEANRDGAPVIELVDGEKLCEKLKELKLGIDVELVEIVKIKHDWFDNI